jgi:hypothetical protein
MHPGSQLLSFENSVSGDNNVAFRRDRAAQPDLD